ncbi:MAG: hypothetical protein HRT45_04615 [Bdellovibrionales bacterium]|nr:hypothetical protein [Bdellovibrionales bacterium]
MPASQFNMWRAVISLMDSDEVRHPEELKHLRNYLKKLPATDEQIEILTNDLS